MTDIYLIQNLNNTYPLNSHTSLPYTGIIYTCCIYWQNQYGCLWWPPTQGEVNNYPKLSGHVTQHFLNPMVKHLDIMDQTIWTVETTINNNNVTTAVIKISWTTVKDNINGLIISLYYSPIKSVTVQGYLHLVTPWYSYISSVSKLANSVKI